MKKTKKYHRTLIVNNKDTKQKLIIKKKKNFHKLSFLIFYSNLDDLNNIHKIL